MEEERKVTFQDICSMLAKPFAEWIVQRLDELGISSKDQDPDTFNIAEALEKCPQFTMLVAGGSYNPPHLMHIENFVRVKRYLANPGNVKSKYEVFGGVIVPSTMGYLVHKLGKRFAIKLEHRIEMCQIAIEDCNSKYQKGDPESLFMQVCVWAKADAEEVVIVILDIVKKSLPRWVWSKVLVCEIFGADYVVKGELWNAVLDYPIFCLPRQGYSEQVIKGLHKSRVRNQMVIFVNDENFLLDPQTDDEKRQAKIRNASSTEIRDVLESSSGDWSKLYEVEILDPKVAKYMIDHQKDLFYLNDSQTHDLTSSDDEQGGNTVCISL
jgi:nicotinic acid mononucleotide adenylyltransferase